MLGFRFVFIEIGVLTPHVLSEWMVEVCRFEVMKCFRFRDGK